MKLFVIMIRNKDNISCPLSSTFSEIKAKEEIRRLNDNEVKTYPIPIVEFYYMSTNFLDKECIMEFKQ